MTNFNEVLKKNLPLLKEYVPVVARVHGKDHPELLEVSNIFSSIQEKLQEESVPNLATDFSKLRDLTNHYLIPENACETYQAVYKMLEELDQAYQE